MSAYTFGFIGVGNMGGAMARAACRTLDPSEVIVASRTTEKAEALARELHCAWGDDAQAAEARYIFLGVKPHLVAGVLAELRPVLKKRKDRFVLVSMAAGITLAELEAMAGLSCPILRIMPNTPCAVGAGVVLYDANAQATEEDIQGFLHGMAAAGLLDPLDEKLMDAGAAVMGCGPAFVFPFIEALSDGGVYCGLPRQKALAYAAKMVEGAAKLMLSEGKHPGELKDQVCSPGGTTIAGVRVLEERGFRGAAMDAVIATVDRTKELSK